MPWPKKHLTEKNVTLVKQAKKWTQEEIGHWNLEHYIVSLRNLDIKKIGREIFGEFQNMLLEKNVEDKMARDSN